MRFKQVLTSTGLLCLSWTSVALAQQTPESSEQLPSPDPQAALDSQLKAVDAAPELVLKRSEPQIELNPPSEALSLKLNVQHSASLLKLTPSQTFRQTSAKADLSTSSLENRQVEQATPTPQTPEHFDNFEGDELTTQPSQALTPLPLAPALEPGEMEEELLPSNQERVLAQVNPDIPPGTIEPTRPTEPLLPNTPLETPTPVPPLTPPESPLLPPEELGVQVQVERVEVLGSTVFSSEQLNEAVASFIGKNLTFEELLSIRTAITQLYTQEGYTTSGAFLPPQDLTSGVVRIQVVEGAIERVEIQGLRHLRPDYVRDRIALAGQAPINLRRLEEALQLLQLDPVIRNVQAELSAGTAPGLSVLTLNVTEAQQLAGALLVENRDSPSVGSVRTTAAVNYNNVLGFGDRLNADFGVTKGLTSFNLGYDVPLNPRNGTFQFGYTRSSSWIVEEPFDGLGIHAESRTFSLGFRQPLIQTPRNEVALSLSVDFRESETFILDEIPFSFSLGPENGVSNVTALRLTQEWVNRSSQRVLAARSQFSLGIDAFGATVNETGVDGRFSSWLGQFQWVEALGQDTILIARVGAQFTRDSLLPIEQFSLGGFDTVRGYRQNQRVADNGLVGSVEVRFPIIRKPEGIGIIQLAPFFDIGTVWNQEGEIPSPSTLASVGLGLRWQLEPFLSARLDWGIPLTSVDDQGDTLQDEGISFAIRLQLF
jgi:hemolysin activation/secretion protein